MQEIDEIRKLLEYKHRIVFDSILTENAYFHKLFDVSHQISTTDLISILRLIIESIVEITRVKRGYLMLSDDVDNPTFKTIVSTPQDNKLDDALSISKSIAFNVIKTGEPEFISNVNLHAEYKNNESIGKLNLKAVLCLPLKVKKRTIGVIYVDSDQYIDYFSESGIKLFEAFASQAAIAIENARLMENLRKENILLKKKIEATSLFENIIYQSKEMEDVMQQVLHLLEEPVTVLIYGETGTGKELIARAIHDNSNRKTRKFIAQNCAAIPEALLESELFGFKKGAFTGATMDKKGLFESVEGGTIFLDEIGEMPLSVQAKLLRVLENDSFIRLGDTTEKKIDVRIIAATNKDLEEEVRKGTFRQDLFFRLNVFPLTIPPLRDRKDDIPVIVHHFVDYYNKKLNKKVEYISRELMDSFINNRWAGNVRELKNTIYRKMIIVPADESELGDTNITPTNKDEVAVQKTLSIENYKTLVDMEKAYIEEVLRAAHYNQSLAARQLGLKRSTFYSKRQKLNIKIPGDGSE